MLGKMKAGGGGVTEDEMFGWHQQVDGQALGVGDGQVMDMELHAAVHGVAKSWTQLSH